ncbi:hypothetical protein J6590_060349 [Homalodisca vitripennis]|nr:hypothetical protein J6590_060349 [Homalodisca vitripennis]
MRSSRQSLYTWEGQSRSLAPITILRQEIEKETPKTLSRLKAVSSSRGLKDVESRLQSSEKEMRDFTNEKCRQNKQSAILLADAVRSGWRVIWRTPPQL